MEEPHSIELEGARHVATYDKFQPPTWWHAGSMAMAATVPSRQSEELYHASVTIPVPSLLRQRIGAILTRQGDNYDPMVTEHICIFKERVEYAEPAKVQQPYTLRLASA